MASTFLLGWPLLVAVVLNYLKRAETAGTPLESHFRWPLRTFWFALPWALAGVALWATLVLIPLAFAVWAGTGLWVAYRVARGWLALARGRPMPMSRALSRRARRPSAAARPSRLASAPRSRG
ncbi:MAG: hypothetical protein RML56_15285 [Burkholderiales bacterium]|nr:hypothetical protein [Burkholderiales bacterium]